MRRTDHPLDLTADALLQGGVLTPSIRRDLADLNRQFLELGLAQELASDPRFAWSEAVRADLCGVDAVTRERMAACPFALFEIVLPLAYPGNVMVSSRVEDAATTGVSGEPWQTRCLAFVYAALFVAWRLADTVPLATRVTLGLSPGSELRLNEMPLSELSRLAACPGLIRPRWPSHARFWAMLRGAARARSSSALRWAHCVGVCLLGSEISEGGGGVPAGPPPGHRPPR